MALFSDIKPKNEVTLYSILNKLSGGKIGKVVEAGKKFTELSPDQQSLLLKSATGQIKVDTSQVPKYPDTELKMPTPSLGKIVEPEDTFFKKIGKSIGVKEKPELELTSEGKSKARQFALQRILSKKPLSPTEKLFAEKGESEFMEKALNAATMGGGEIPATISRLIKIMKAKGIAKEAMPKLMDIFAKTNKIELGAKGLIGDIKNIGTKFKTFLVKQEGVPPKKPISPELQPLAQEARKKADTVLKLMGNELEDINIIGSTAGGKLNPNDLDILITPRNKLPALSSVPKTSGESIYARQDLAKVFKDELQPLFPDKKIHITIADYDPTKGAKMPIGEYNPLVAEAKKIAARGGTAEEFVKAQGMPVYRGGEKFTGDVGERGLPLTTDKKIAETFAREKKAFRESPAGQILGLKSEDIVLEEYIISPSAKIATKKDIPNNIFEAYKKANPVTEPEIAEPIISKWARDNGFDAVDFSTLGKTSAKEAEIKILNKNVIKTKSQLTDIWNQAIKGAKGGRLEISKGLPELPKLSSPPDISVENNIKSLSQKIVTPEQQALQKSATEQATKSLKPSSEGIIPPSATAEIANIENSVNKKVNLLDWFRTPDRVLQKIGLGKEAELLKKKYNDYLDDLPKEINKITDWWVEVKDIPNSSQNIFKYLDGQSIQLSPIELKVANEMKVYLGNWARKLKLPEDKRIANYITHIFEEGFIKKEFDQDLAKIISDRVAGAVYDPFLEKRLGKLGYKEDVFAALDAYVKRGTRKYHMDTALEVIKKASDSLDLDSYKYVESLISRVNLRPTQIDNYLDNLIKQTIGYKLGARPTARVSRVTRQAVYRGTLGLNVTSAIRNLTQGVNTYAQLGEKYTALGYMKTIREILTRGDELEKVGVLRDNFIQDRELSAIKGFLEKLDTGLWSLFQTAEKINRGAAYFGAKAKAFKRGLSESEAVKEGVEMARKTQFTFSSVDTPVALQSDLIKTFTQFQSFNIKQTEFLAEMIKDKKFAGIARWVGGNLLIMATIGKLFGYDLEDMLPFSGIFTGRTKLGETPPVQLTGSILGAIMGAPDKYGKERTTQQKLKDILNKLKPFVPAGIQISKTADTLKALLDKGKVKSASGKTINFRINTKDYPNIIRALLFGKYQSKEGQEYLKKIKGKSTKSKGLFSNIKPK